MKILCILTKLYLPGGGDVKEGAYPTLVRTHVRAGFDVTALAFSTPSNAGANEIEAAREVMGGAKYLIVSRRNMLKLPLLFFKYWDLLLVRYIWTYRHLLLSVDEHFANHERPNVIAALTAVENTGIVAYLISKRYNIPFTVLETRTSYEEGLVQNKRAEIAKKVVMAAEPLLVVSPHHKESIKQALQIDLSNVDILTYAIPDHFFEEPHSPDWLHEFAKERFIFAGWTMWDGRRNIKRLDLALQSFAKVHAHSSNTCLIIAGSVPDWARTIIDDLNITDSVLFTGSINRDKIKDLAHKCDCCIVPSDYDPLGLPVMEALAAGKPVVATRCGGPDSVITDKSLGRLIEKGNSTAFAEAMTDVLQNYSQFNKVAIQAYCKKNYSEEAISEKLKKIYKNFINT